jgi:hypothetical protein
MCRACAICRSGCASAGRSSAARQQADEAIRRAQRKARRDGNVIRPEAFKGPRNAH